MPLSPLDDPELLPFKLDLPERRLLLVRMDAAQRAAAAFLDERALAADTGGGWIGLDALLARAVPAAAVTAPDFVFHIGHCGSTLLSRLLAAWPEVQALREPLPLRTLAEAHGQLDLPESRLAPAEWQAALRGLLGLWRRPLPPAQRVVVKATSSCNGLIAPILHAAPAARAILLDMPLAPYLATLLKSPGSLRDALNAAPERLRSLHAGGHAELRLHALAPAEQCAMGWIAEQLRFEHIARGAAGARVLRVDFERLLAAPEAVLGGIAAHLQLAPGGVAVALASPAWQRYSKAPDHGYDAGDRAHDLALARERHGAAIAAGLAWARPWLERHPPLAARAGWL